MACFHPLTAYRSMQRDEETGKYPLSFSRPSVCGPTYQVPCGQCIGCRIDRSRQWAVRCMAEASLYTKNCFITLTYDDMHMNETGTLVKEDFQFFMKRLRKLYGEGIRFYHCGEYGEEFNRPHHHACLFNFDFPDKVLWRDGDMKLWRSSTLESLWQHRGYCTVGAVTVETAAYVARYCMKKITGKRAKEHYNGVLPEYSTMSRRPGIGRDFYEKWKDDIFPSDELIFNGKTFPVPKYFSRCFELTNPEEYGNIKAKRKEEALKREDSDMHKLPVREKILESRCKYFKREYEKTGGMS